MSRRLPLLTLLAGAALLLSSAIPAQPAKDKDAKDRSKAVGTPKPAPAITGYEKQTIHGITPFMIRGKTNEAITALEWLSEEMPDARVAPV